MPHRTIAVTDSILSRDTSGSDNGVCFTTGTAIRTTRGDVPVEALRVGDTAVTATGAHRPIRWIGRRTLDCAGHPQPASVRPVRVAAGAFGDGRPTADLALSPFHAVAATCVTEVLIPVCLLCNGTTIVRLAEAGSVTYWHVALDGHDLLLANGLPAESFTDTGRRDEFEGEASLVLHPTFAGGGAAACRPIVTGGSVLAAVRAQLAALAGVSEPTSAPRGLRLVADGTVLEARIRDNKACCLVPAGTGDLRIVSPVFQPSGGDDDRHLGVLVETIAVEDLFGTARPVALHDAGLIAGFHPIERSATGTWRWTNGDARLAASLWAGHADSFILRLTGQFDHAAFLEPPAKAAPAEA